MRNTWVSSLFQGYHSKILGSFKEPLCRGGDEKILLCRIIASECG